MNCISLGLLLCPRPTLSATEPATLVATALRDRLQQHAVRIVRLGDMEQADRESFENGARVIYEDFDSHLGDSSTSACSGACKAGRYGAGGSTDDNCSGQCQAGRYSAATNGETSAICSGEISAGYWVG